MRRKTEPPPELAKKFRRLRNNSLRADCNQPQYSRRIFGGHKIFGGGYFLPTFPRTSTSIYLNAALPGRCSPSEAFTNVSIFSKRYSGALQVRGITRASSFEITSTTVFSRQTLPNCILQRDNLGTKPKR